MGYSREGHPLQRNSKFPNRRQISSKEFGVFFSFMKGILQHEKQYGITNSEISFKRKFLAIIKHSNLYRTSNPI